MIASLGLGGGATPDLQASAAPLEIMVGLFVAAAIVMAAAAAPSLILGGRRRMLTADDRPATRSNRGY